jgi:endonuclease/exonuclease/phosphatase family metal-dependent hydrolase
LADRVTAPSPSSADTTLRVVTWNTWWCFGPWRERQPLLSAALAEQQADVVLLQETWPGQARTLAEVCGLEVIALSVGAFRPQGGNGEPAGWAFGNAVLGRSGQARPLGTVPLPSAQDGAPRSGVAVAWERAGAGLALVATHLNHIAGASAVRQHQLETLAEWIGGLRPTGPVVLGGDLNLTPYSPEYRDGIEARWVDLWPLARPGDPGATMVPENPRFRDTEWMAERNGRTEPPGVRFDYLLARRSAGGALGLTVDRIDVVGTARHAWPSDHLGLVCDLRLDGGGRSGAER